MSIPDCCDLAGFILLSPCKLARKSTEASRCSGAEKAIGRSYSIPQRDFTVIAGSSAFVDSNLQSFFQNNCDDIVRHEFNHLRQFFGVRYDALYCDVPIAFGESIRGPQR